MASVSQIRDAIKSTLDAIASLHVYDTVRDAHNIPAAIVAVAEADFLKAMGRGMDTWEFDVFVLAPYADPDLGQDSLDGFVNGFGSNSIRQVIFNSRTLGLSNTDAHVSRLTDYGGQFEDAAVNHIGAVLRVVVHTTGTA